MSVDSCSVNPLVSIIVPIYNTPSVPLERCMSSILNQTYFNIEILIVDDGSNNETKAVIRTFAENDSRIRVLSGGHQGVSLARNLGIDEAKGEWIAFSDADDEISIYFVEDALKIALSEKVDLVCGSVENIFEGQEKSVNIRNSECFVFSNQQDLTSAKLQMLSPVKYSYFLGPNFKGRGPAAKLYRASVFGNLRYDKTISIGEDALFNYFFINNCSSIAILDTVWYWYYQYQTSTMHIVDISKWKSSIEGILNACHANRLDYIAAQSRVTFMIAQGLEAIIVESGPFCGYQKGMELLRYAEKIGLFSKNLFIGYEPSFWLRIFSCLCKSGNLRLAYWCCVGKHLIKNIFMKKKLIEEEIKC